MGMTTYLAVTAGELETLQSSNVPIAWMACHFSPYSTGLSNLPMQFPPESLVMVNDRTPIWHHDPKRISAELNDLVQVLQPRGIVLDFQRLGCPETAKLASFLAESLTCPVAVSEGYGAGLSCPVFLSCPPLCTPLEAHLAPWEGREIWLEAVHSREILTLTEDGCCREEYPPLEEVLPFAHPQLYCRYGYVLEEERVTFTLQRGASELSNLLHQAEGLGITTAIGLYQQYKEKSSV